MTQLVKPVKKIRKQFLRKLDGKRSPPKNTTAEAFHPDYHIHTSIKRIFGTN